MKTNTGSTKFIVILAIVLFIGSALFYSYKSNSKSKEIADMADKKIGVMMEDGILLEDNLEKDEVATTEEGVYQKYDEDLLKENEEKKIVLFFNATWCPTCKLVDKELKSSPIPENLLVLSVDYDKYTDLKKKYGVTYQHTFVLVDSNGLMIKKWSGDGLDKIIENIK